MDVERGRAAEGETTLSIRFIPPTHACTSLFDGQEQANFEMTSIPFFPLAIIKYMP